MTLLLGVAALAIILFALWTFSRADPHLLAQRIQTLGGWGLLLLAGYLGVTGRFYAAIPVALFAAGLLGWLPQPASLGARMRRTPGQTSRVRATAVEMELDHDTGAMRGRMLAGQYKDVPLEALDGPTLIKLLGEVDAESRALLEAYLDRRDPGWREHVEEDHGAGRAEPPRHGPMTEEEAYQILGLEPGASSFEVRRAHRSLMKKLHPDQGGSNYLAARVNQAKDVLLRRRHH
jgi:hypothetical protein